jgi:hypothetical protein
MILRRVARTPLRRGDEDEAILFSVFFFGCTPELSFGLVRPGRRLQAGILLQRVCSWEPQRMRGSLTACNGSLAVSVCLPGRVGGSSSCRSCSSRARTRVSRPAATGRNGPTDPKPSYAAIDAQPLNKIVYGLFRRKMVSALDNRDSALEGYDGIVDLTRRLNALGSPRQTQALTRRILNSLFPSWLPPAFRVMFAKPLPDLSCRLNALATWLTCQWLMGECEINAVEVDGGEVREGYGVLVKRCRYLEETGCVGVCINSCKVPTQEFFEKDMGLPLTMEPNYETFECQFSFGKTPPAPEMDDAFASTCFAQCSTRTNEDGDEMRCRRLEI